MERIIITQAIKDALKSERDRTGVNPSYLLRATNSAIPNGLTINMPGGWLSGSTKTLDLQHFEFILNEYQKLPTNHIEYIPVTRELSRHLRAERERTGYKLPEFLKRFEHSIPDGLEHYIINNWITRQTRNGRKDQIDWVLARYAELPDI